MDIIAETKKKMSAALEHLKHEFKNIRAGRASPALIESLMIDVYGAAMPIKQLATITAPEPRQLLVSPFDGANAQSISKGIEKANLGLTVILEGKSMRVVFPDLDANRRKELINQCNKRKEECKIALRNVRRDQNEELKKQKLPEDDVKRFEKQIQELTDKSCKEAEDLTHVKEKEISTV